MANKPIQFKAVILVQKRNERGHKVTVRKCDSKCYNAGPRPIGKRGKPIGKKSVCCCGGVNRGVGFDAAVENVIRNASLIRSFYTKPGQWVETAFKQDGLLVGIPLEDV